MRLNRNYGKANILREAFNKPESERLGFLTKNNMIPVPLSHDVKQAEHTRWGHKLKTGNAARKFVPEFNQVQSTALLKLQGNTCIICGCEFNLDAVRIFSSNSKQGCLDRLFDDKPYSLGNVAFMLVKINYAKGVCPAFFSNEHFLEYCKTHNLSPNTKILDVASQISREYIDDLIAFNKDSI